MTEKAVLIVSNSEDAHANVVAERLHERAIRAYRLDSDTFVTNKCVWTILHKLEGPVHSDWTKDDVHTVWYRKVFFPEPTDATSSFIRQESEGLLASILAQYEHCKWVNPRPQLELAKAKVAQLLRARQLGFRIPDSVVTNDQDVLRKFAARHQGHIVAKPIHAQIIGNESEALVVGTRNLTPEHYAAATSYVPCYAQEQLHIRAEIRVVVFAKHLYAFRLIPQADAQDIKQLPLQKIVHEPCELEETLAYRVNQLMQSYGLLFGAVDFAVVDDDEPVFLELNPNGQWLWLQYMTGVNLLDPFIDMLCS